MWRIIVGLVLFCVGVLLAVTRTEPKADGLLLSILILGGAGIYLLATAVPRR